MNEFFLSEYQERFSLYMKRSLLQLDGFEALSEACAYSLSAGGKFIRPALVYMTAQGLGTGGENNDAVDAAALCVEVFHCSSLIADDLPCMDNDNERRGRPSCHKAFGETTALLASYTLIAWGYEALMCAQKSFCGTDAALRGCEAVALSARATGLFGLTGGQFLDIFNKEKTIESYQKITKYKTAALFELSMALGWIFGGGALESIQDVLQAAFHLGQAFQLQDDIGDREKDARQDAPNFANLTSVEKTIERIQEELCAFEEKLVKLKIKNPNLQRLGQFIAYKAQKAALLEV